MDPFSRVSREGILLTGGAHAILMQIAHPLVGAGVAEHSDFVSDPLKRLRGTLGFVYAQSSGDTALMDATAALVTRAHARVRRDTTPGAPGYSANDPELQLWVVATLYHAADRVHRRVFGPLSSADADAVYRGYARLGTALGMPDELWPIDRAAFATYWDNAVAELTVTPQAAAVAADLLHPSRPLVLRPLMPLVRVVTAAMLTPDLRRAFDLPLSARGSRTVRLLAGAARVIWPRLPLGVRSLPQRITLAQLRRYLANSETAQSPSTLAS
ncbi:MAG: oxygenase MpaB family protein [Mycetocola sp.]